MVRAQIAKWPGVAASEGMGESSGGQGIRQGVEGIVSCPYSDEAVMVWKSVTHSSLGPAWDSLSRVSIKGVPFRQVRPLRPSESSCSFHNLSIVN